jgi:outer membrane protein
MLIFIFGAFRMLRVAAVAAAATVLLVPAHAQTYPQVLRNAAQRHLQPGQQAGAGAAAQAPGSSLTLEQARQMALANHPQVRAAQWAAGEASAQTTEARSSYFPTIGGDITGVESNDARLAAGGLNAPHLYNRFAAGMSLEQLVTDFGRTRNLVSSAKLHAQSAGENVDLSRQQVLLNVDRAFYNQLSAQAVLKVAQQTVDNRQLVADQIHALAQANLRSQLDVSFADANLAQAKMLLLQAQNDEQSAQAVLSEALGLAQLRRFTLIDPGLPAQPSALEDAIAAALRDRPDIQAQRLEQQSAEHYAIAERDLWMPQVELAGSAGDAPFAQAAVPPTWAAVGFNVHLPFFNGKLYNARHVAAQDRARQAAEELRNVEDQASRDVRVAWLAANTAYQNLALTAQFLAASQQALDLATERYKLGLSSIVELSQAQLNQEQASIAQATATYGYAASVSALLFQEGALR